MLNKLRNKKNNKGFTLVELLVVIAIIGILAVVAVPSLFKQVDKAKASQVVANVKALKTEIMTEYANANADSAVITTINGGTYIKDLLELDSASKGKLGETYSVTDDASKVEGKVEITITCPDNDKAKIIAQQLGVTLSTPATDVAVKYPVGKK